MTRRGLTQTDLSAHLGLTKQAVSKVFRGGGEKLFNPQNTLALAEILDLPIEDLLIGVDSPYIWTQKNEISSPETDQSNTQSDDKIWISELDRLLPFDFLERNPVRLRNPNTDPIYARDAIGVVWRGVGPPNEADLLDILRRQLNAVVIPCVWKDSKAENVEIFHSHKSGVNWVRINLLYGWRRHSLALGVGRCLAESLSKEKASIFANKFSEELLLPREMIQKLYQAIHSQKGFELKLHLLKHYDLSLPKSVVLEKLDRFADESDQPRLNRMLHKRIGEETKIAKWNIDYYGENYIKFCKKILVHDTWLILLKKLFLKNRNGVEIFTKTTGLSEQQAKKIRDEYIQSNLTINSNGK